MVELRQRNVSIFRSWVNPFLSVLFVGTFSLGAFLIVYDVAVGENPVATMFATVLESETELEGN